MTKPANDEMVLGYMDGYDLDNPEPNENRSHSYRHGFMVGRAEKQGKYPGRADILFKMADQAMAKDETALF